MMPLLSRLLGPFLPQIGIGMTVALALALAWGLRVDHLRGVYKAQRDAVRAEYRIFRTAIIDRTAAALTKQKEVAHASDLAHDAALADARAAADRYIADHRLRPPAAHPRAAAAAPDPGVPEIAAAHAVLVSEDDIKACTDAAEYALSAHRWAVEAADVTAGGATSP